MKKLSFLSAVVVGMVLSALALPAFGAEGAGGAQEKATEIFKWINFAILAAFFLWLATKKLPPIFKGRAEAIGSAIAKSTAAKAEADRILAEAETKLAHLDQEIAELRVLGQKDAEVETERIRAIAKSDVLKIGAAAKLEMEAAERAARVELKRIAARLAIDGAESLLTKQLTPKTQEALIADFVKNLEGSPN